MPQQHINIRQAEVRDAHIVVDMVQRLLLELGGFQAFDTPTIVSLCTQLLSTDLFTAFLAESPTRSSLGVITLAECPALYVSGRIGWIQELYVAPEARSLGTGHQLIIAATNYGQKRQWQRLEVNTPDASAWPRTVSRLLSARRL
ncbi:MAG: GNAT family N-acetyltransferase [Ktedonobacteraceae bacterium]